MKLNQEIRLIKDNEDLLLLKSRLSQRVALVNASRDTNFTYIIQGHAISPSDVEEINNYDTFTEIINKIESLGCTLEFVTVDRPVFKLNLQTIDYYFDQMIAKMLVLFCKNVGSKGATVRELVSKVASENFLNYDLKRNSSMYEMHMKKFLTDYALGMKANKVWKRTYEANGGYVVVRFDGELVCYHFYFAQQFEEFLFNNTKFDTGSRTRHRFGKIYTEDDKQYIKLNLLVRFI